MTEPFRCQLNFIFRTTRKYPVELDSYWIPCKRPPRPNAKPKYVREPIGLQYCTVPLKSPDLWLIDVPAAMLHSFTPGSIFSNAALAASTILHHQTALLGLCYFCKQVRKLHQTSFRHRLAGVTDLA